MYSIMIIKVSQILLIIISLGILILSCAKEDEAKVETKSDNSSNSDNDTNIDNEAPNQVVFTKSIMDPDATKTSDYEEWASEVILTSEGGYIVVGRSISWAWPTPDNVDDILIVKLDGNGNIIWNKKIHLRNYDKATSVVEDNDGNYCRVVRSSGTEYDMIIVDGRDRLNCVRQSLQALSEKGVIILDDSHRKRYQVCIKEVKKSGFLALDFEGLKPTGNEIDRTTVFYRRNNCLNI